jgi:hypothetical protein
MKPLNYYLLCILALAFSAKGFAQANTSLSNLVSTKINVSLLPDKNQARNLGSGAKAWKNLYLDSAVYLGNSRFLAAYSGTGTSNTAVGENTLIANTTGSYNSAIGYSTLANNKTGDYNTASGYQALMDNAGWYNTAQGAFALTHDTSGYQNTAIGVSTLYNNTTGINNTATGMDALAGNTTGSNNTATGAGALYSNNGSYNTAVGIDALNNTTASEYNTAVGYNAGTTYDNGYNNVFVGANVDVNGTGYFNDIAIGQGTVCTQVSQVTIGNGATTSYIAYANWSNISDGRFKKNIKQNVPGLAFINKLQPITYTLDATGIDNFLHSGQAQDNQLNGQAKTLMNKALAEKEKTIYTGFIAQDVEKAAKSLNYDFSGVDAAKNDKDLYGLRYSEFVVPLVKAVQELSKMNDVKDSAIQQQNLKIDDLQKQLDDLKNIINHSGVSSQTSVDNSQSFNISSASLSQNIPNPFDHSTTINYTLPQTYSSAKIIVTDNSGKTLKELSINAKGKGSLNIDASTLSSRAYQYSLIVDGRLIDTKQMERIK